MRWAVILICLWSVIGVPCPDGDGESTLEKFAEGALPLKRAGYVDAQLAKFNRSGRGSEYGLIPSPDEMASLLNHVAMYVEDDAVDAFRQIVARRYKHFAHQATARKTDGLIRARDYLAPLAATRVQILTTLQFPMEGSVTSYILENIMLLTTRNLEGRIGDREFKRFHQVLFDHWVSVRAGVNVDDLSRVRTALSYRPAPEDTDQRPVRQRPNFNFALDRGVVVGFGKAVSTWGKRGGDSVSPDPEEFERIFTASDVHHSRLTPLHDLLLGEFVSLAELGRLMSPGRELWKRMDRLLSIRDRLALLQHPTVRERVPADQRLQYEIEILQYAERYLRDEVDAMGFLDLSGVVVLRLRDHHGVAIDGLK